MSLGEDLNTNNIESDYEDYSHEIPADEDSVIYEGETWDTSLENDFELGEENVDEPGKIF